MPMLPRCRCQGTLINAEFAKGLTALLADSDFVAAAPASLKRRGLRAGMDAVAASWRSGLGSLLLHGLLFVLIMCSAGGGGSLPGDGGPAGDVMTIYRVDGPPGFQAGPPGQELPSEPSALDAQLAELDCPPQPVEPAEPEPEPVPVEPEPVPAEPEPEPVPVEPEPTPEVPEQAVPVLNEKRLPEPVKKEVTPPPPKPSQKKPKRKPASTEQKPAADPPPKPRQAESRPAQAAGSGQAQGAGGGGSTGHGAGNPSGSGTGQGGAFPALAKPDVPPVLTRRQEPPFPVKARQMGISGKVTVRLLVNVAGEVERLLIVSAKPAGMFEEAVKVTVPKWRFHPARKDGAPVPAWVVAPILFDLRGRD